MSTVNKSTLQVPEERIDIENLSICCLKIYQTLKSVPLVDDSSSNEENEDLISLQFGQEDVLFHCMTRPTPSSLSSHRSLPARTRACCCSPLSTAAVLRCILMLVGRTAGFGCNNCSSVIIKWEDSVWESAKTIWCFSLKTGLCIPLTPHLYYGRYAKMFGSENLKLWLTLMFCSQSFQHSTYHLLIFGW